MKRTGRARGRDGIENLRRFLIGLVVSIGVTALCIVLFALLIQWMDLGQNLITPINQFIKVIAIVVGTFFAVRAPMKAYKMGPLIGLSYMALGIVLYSVIDLNLLPIVVILGDLALGAGAGFLSGLLASTFKKTE